MNASGQKKQIVPTPRQRRQHNREAMIAAILQAGREIMRENGAAGLTMNELARRVGMRPPSLYNYFSGLMDVYDALFRLGFALWGEYLEEYIQDARTWQDQIRLAMEAYMTFAMQNPELYQLCFERPVPRFVPSEESLRVSFGNLEEVYARVAALQDAVQTDLRPQQMADLVIAISHGLTALHMANEPELPVGQGRFGALIPAVLTVLSKAWSKEQTIKE
jgi:AcrR family transcriptional regulator